MRKGKVHLNLQIMYDDACMYLGFFCSSTTNQLLRVVAWRHLKHAFVEVQCETAEVLDSDSFWLRRKKIRPLKNQAVILHLCHI